MSVRYYNLKLYESPELNIIDLISKDIITSSSEIYDPFGDDPFAPKQTDNNDPYVVDQY